jgi:hypothetical protein
MTAHAAAHLNGPDIEGSDKLSTDFVENSVKKTSHDCHDKAGTNLIKK